MTIPEIGSIVRVAAPGSRESEGREQIIPALVIGRYPDGKIDLYCLHFQGSPLLSHAVSPDVVEVIFNPAEMQKVLKRLDEIEKHMGLAKPVQEQPRFSLADGAI